MDNSSVRETQKTPACFAATVAFEELWSSLKGHPIDTLYGCATIHTGLTGYLDYLRAEDFPESITKGRDIDERRFIAIRVKVEVRDINHLNLSAERRSDLVVVHERYTFLTKLPGTGQPRSVPNRHHQIWVPANKLTESLGINPHEGSGISGTLKLMEGGLLSGTHRNWSYTAKMY